MSTENETRTAIVTGGSGGIGRAIAERLGSESYNVVVHFSGNPDRAREAADAVTAAGGRAVTARADIADEAEVAALFDTAREEFGGVDAVINTAGIMTLAPIVDTDLADFDRMQRTNVRGTFVVNQAAARSVRAGGSIVNFTTSIVRLAAPTYGAYAASKGAVEALTLILARELRGKDITVNAIGPGPTATPLFLDGKPQEIIDGLAKAAPLERLGQPDDIASAVMSVLQSRWINGQVLYVNGGIA